MLVLTTCFEGREGTPLPTRCSSHAELSRRFERMPERQCSMRDSLRSCGKERGERTLAGGPQGFGLRTGGDCYTAGGAGHLRRPASPHELLGGTQSLAELWTSFFSLRNGTPS